MIKTPYLPIFQLTRGDTEESIHFGAIAVVDAQGKLVASHGDPEGVAFLRSTAKPLQALPFIEAGGHTHYGLTQKEIALICASHSGTDAHVETLQSIQAKAGFGEELLQCGTHPVPDKDTAAEMIRQGKEPTPNRHNCSGKHTGMLAFAKMRGWPLENYLEYDHPLQKLLLQTFAEVCGVPVEEVKLGMDGCTAPNYAVPFYNAALGLANLADPQNLSEERAAACRTITTAMMAHPDMVGGPKRFDTVLMEVGAGRFLAKGGAEGFQGVYLMPGAMGEGSPALGIAIKISDGDAYGRARSAVALEVLRQLGALTPADQEALREFGPRGDVLNWRKLVIGEKYPLFKF